MLPGRQNKGQRRRGWGGGGRRVQQPRAPGLCQASAALWLALPSWLQAPYSLMTLGWLTCFSRLNSDSRSRSSFGEAFSETHVNKEGCKPIPVKTPSVTMQGHINTHWGSARTHYLLLKHLTPGSHSLGLLSAHRMVGLFHLWE